MATSTPAFVKYVITLCMLYLSVWCPHTQLNMYSNLHTFYRTNIECYVFSLQYMYKLNWILASMNYKCKNEENLQEKHVNV